MHPHTYDPYAFLLPLCRTAAFRLPPPLPGPRPLTDDDIRDNLFEPIPDHLLFQYLCFEPSPPPPATSAAAPAPSLLELPIPPPPNFADSITDLSCSGPLPHDPPCCSHVSHPDYSASDQGHPDLQDDVVHENLPFCVVNYQASLPSTPEGEGFSEAVGDGDLCDERPTLLLSEIKELALWPEDQGLDDNDTEHIVSLMTTFRNLAFAVGYTERLLSQIKELALCHEGVVLDDDYINYMVSVMTKVRNLAFYSKDRKNCRYVSDLPEPSKKKQRKSETKSNMVVSTNYFARCKSANADASNYCTIDLDNCLSTKRKSNGKEIESPVGTMTKFCSGCPRLVSEDVNVEIIDLTDDGPSTGEKVNVDALANFLDDQYVKKVASFNISSVAYVK